MKTRILVLGAVAFFSLNSAFADLSVPESTVACVPSATGLVGWWPAEGSADDVIGGDNGTLQGGATFATGEVGQGFHFDGTNGYVQIPDSAALKPTHVTVEAWVWLDPSLPSGRGGEQIVFKKNTWSAWFEGYSLLKRPLTTETELTRTVSNFVSHDMAIRSPLIPRPSHSAACGITLPRHMMATSPFYTSTAWPRRRRRRASRSITIRPRFSSAHPAPGHPISPCLAESLTKFRFTIAPFL